MGYLMATWLGALSLLALAAAAGAITTVVPDLPDSMETSSMRPSMIDRPQLFRNPFKNPRIEYSPLLSHDSQLGRWWKSTRSRTSASSWAA